MSKSVPIHQRDVTEAHKLCSSHEPAVKASKLAGCFYCCRTYAPAEIREWRKERYEGGTTAHCPKCGIDSVLPLGDESAEACGPFLHAMHERWFGDH